AACSRVSANSAALEVLYALPANGWTRWPAIEVTFTIEPSPCCRRLASAREKCTGAKKLIANTSCQRARSPSRQPRRWPSGPLGEKPALLTRRSEERRGGEGCGT